MATRGRGRSLGRHGKAVTVKVRVDPARRRRFEELVETMRQARREEASGFDAYWEAVGEIIESEIYFAGGYETAKAFLAAEVKEPERTAKRMIRVARYASPAEEQRYGVAILDAALAYIEAKTGGPVRGKLPIRLEALRVPVLRDERERTLPLDEVTFADLQAATRALLRRGGKERARQSPVEAAIVKSLKSSKLLAQVSVHVAGGRVRLGAIPVGALSDLGRVLVRLRLSA